MVMALSHHASQRMQQRAIPPIVVDLLDRFGSTQRSNGAETVFFDKAARKRLEQYVGGRRSMRHLEALLGFKMVVGDNGRIVTVAHRTKRINRS
jgi:hypothetical protein